MSASLARRDPTGLEGGPGAGPGEGRDGRGVQAGGLGPGTEADSTGRSGRGDGPVPLVTLGVGDGDQGEIGGDNVTRAHVELGERAQG